MAWLRVKRDEFNQDILRHYRDFVRAQDQTSLSYLQRQLIFVVVSTVNKCRY